MKRFTLATLAILVSAGSILTLSPSVKAESRQEYCRYHLCNYNRDYNYNYNRGYNRDYNYNYNRSYNRNYHARNDHRQHESRTGHYGNR